MEKLLAWLVPAPLPSDEESWRRNREKKIFLLWQKPHLEMNSLACLCSFLGRAWLVWQPI